MPSRPDPEPLPGGDDNPVTQWLHALEDGDEQAAGRLWEHFFERLTHVARRHLANRRATDEEDIAASVFHRLYVAAGKGRMAEVRSRDDLWRLLFTMTVRRSIDANRRGAAARRGGGQVRGDSLFAASTGRAGNWDLIAGEDVPPDLLALVDEQFGQLLEQLSDDRLRQIALWRLEGWSNQEIAEELQVTVRSVERKLQRIRELWADSDPGR